MGAGDRVVLGRVVGAFGIQGWIRVKPFTESFEGLIEQTSWTLSRAGVGRNVVVEEWKPHAGSLLAKVKGIDDRTGAEAFRGADVTVSREMLPKADEGEYYWSDLIGLAVRNERGVELGVVAGLIAAPAHDVLRVESDVLAGDVNTATGDGNAVAGAAVADDREAGDAVAGDSDAVAGVGKREQLIPFVEPIVKGVDLANRTVTVDWELDY